MSNVVKLTLVECGEKFRFDTDAVLDGAKGLAFKVLAIIGEQEDGEMYLAGNASAGEIMILMEMAKHRIAFGRWPE